MTCAELYLKWADIFIRFIQAIAWPLAISILGYYVLKNYKPAIENLLLRLKRSTFPGGSFELATAEKERQIEEKTQEWERTKALEDQAKKQHAKIIDELMEKAKLQDDERSAIIESLARARETIENLQNRQVLLERELGEAQFSILTNTMDMDSIAANNNIVRTEDGHLIITTVNPNVSPMSNRKAYQIIKDVFLEINDGCTIEDVKEEFMHLGATNSGIVNIRPQRNNKQVFVDYMTSSPMSATRILNGLKQQAKSFRIIK